MKTTEDFAELAFSYQDEVEQWKIVKFGWDNLCAVRSSGESIQFDREEKAREHVKAMAARALVEDYLERTQRAIASLVGAPQP